MNMYGLSPLSRRKFSTELREKREALSKGKK
jgi:hypothetical protein